MVGSPFLFFKKYIYYYVGAPSLVKHFHNCGIPMAVATGSDIHSYQQKVSMHSDIFCCFHHIVCSDDKEVENGKPSPDIYLVAAKRFSILPESNSHVSNGRAIFPWRACGVMHDCVCICLCSTSHLWDTNKVTGKLINYS